MDTVLITHFLDKNTLIPLVSVPLTNINRNCILWQEDFNKLYELGLDPRWRFSIGQVLERGKARVSIARLVANANAGDKIMFLDKDPCNLRRSNLLTAAGAGRYKTRDTFSLDNRRHTFGRSKVLLKHIGIKESWMPDVSEAHLDELAVS